MERRVNGANDRRGGALPNDDFGVMGRTPPGGIDVPKWRCEHTT